MQTSLSGDFFFAFSMASVPGDGLPGDMIITGDRGGDAWRFFDYAEGSSIMWAARIQGDGTDGYIGGAGEPWEPSVPIPAPSAMLLAIAGVTGLSGTKRTCGHKSPV